MLSFIVEFFRNPAIVGSFIPSSRWLASKIVEPINFDRANCIVEYGPGTGVFTDVLIQRCRPGTVLIAVEANQRFAQLLQERYAEHPNVHIIHGSADQTNGYLRERGLVGADYVVSGLPFLSLPRRLGWRVLEVTQQVLVPTGRLILFQYSLRNLKLFGRFFRLCGRAHVLLNLPPAYVLVYRSRQISARGPADDGRRELTAAVAQYP